MICQVRPRNLLNDGQKTDLVAPAAFDYLELAAWPMMLARIARCIIETSGHQFADSPDMISNPERHSGRLADTRQKM